MMLVDLMDKIYRQARVVYQYSNIDITLTRDADWSGDLKYIATASMDGTSVARCRADNPEEALEGLLAKIIGSVLIVR
jgi:hypothetical protein